MCVVCGVVWCGVVWCGVWSARTGRARRRAAQKETERRGEGHVAAVGERGDHEAAAVAHVLEAGVWCVVYGVWCVV